MGKNHTLFSFFLHCFETLINFLEYNFELIVSLYLLVIEAGIDIDLTTLKLIGMRGIVIALIGSVLPIAIAIGIAFALGYDTVTSVAAGAAFGPTSLGIAMNILRQGKIVNT